MMREIGKIEGLITLEALWAVFAKLKGAKYGSSVELRSGFAADAEMIYHAYQKEFNAQAKIGTN